MCKTLNRITCDPVSARTSPMGRALRTHPEVRAITLCLVADIQAHTFAPLSETSWQGRHHSRHVDHKEGGPANAVTCRTEPKLRNLSICWSIRLAPRDVYRDVRGRTT